MTHSSSKRTGLTSTHQFVCILPSFHHTRLHQAQGNFPYQTCPVCPRLSLFHTFFFFISMFFSVWIFSSPIYLKVRKGGGTMLRQYKWFLICFIGVCPSYPKVINLLIHVSQITSVFPVDLNSSSSKILYSLLIFLKHFWFWCPDFRKL